MKLILLLFFSFFLAGSVNAQSYATAVADRIAQRMKDSLSLSAGQKDSIYAVNIRLHNQKALLRQQYTSIDSLEYHTQLVERTRDSLYMRVLGDEKYLLYKSKKRNLISN